MLPNYGQPIVRSDPQTFPDNIKLFFGDDNDASIYYDGSDLVINPKEVGGGSLKLLGDFDLNGQGSILNVGAAGNDWTAASFNHSGSGLGRFTREVSLTNVLVGSFNVVLETSGDMADGFGPTVTFLGTDSGVSLTVFGDIAFRRAGADNTGDFVVGTRVAGVFNEAFRVTSTGIGSFDAAGDGTGLPSLFDDFDDPLVLRRGISLGHREELESMGVMERKDTGSGWFLNIQPFVYLLAGGVYQNRQRIDERYDELDQRMKKLGV